MLETLALTTLIYLFLNRNKKRKRKPRTLDAELRKLIAESNETKENGQQIKNYLLSVINDANHDAGRFTDKQLAEAQAILDKLGPNALYFMTDIAAQLAFLAAAQINKTPTNVDEALKDSATAEEIIELVVRVK
jgi:hypothetical protein